MSWLLLFTAIALEVAGTTTLKLSQGFTRVVPSILMFVLYGLSFGAMTLSLKHIDLSIVYALWSGIGTALIVVIGLVWFREPMTPVKLICLLLIVAGAVGLNLTTKVH